jgi:hypothetical protein
MNDCHLNNTTKLKYIYEYDLCHWPKCKQDYAIVPSVNMNLMIELKFVRDIFNLKLIFTNKNYSKFNIYMTLNLKITKSPTRNPIYHPGLSFSSSKIFGPMSLKVLI